MKIVFLVSLFALAAFASPEAMDLTPPDDLEGEVFWVAYSPISSLVALPRYYNGFSLKDLDSGKWIRVEDEHGAVRAAFSANGKYLGVTAYYTKTVQLWDISNLKKTIKIFETPDLKGSGHSICFSPDGKLIASAHTDGRVHLTEVPSGKEKLVFSGSDHYSSSLSFSSSGAYLTALTQRRELAKGAVGEIRVWNLQKAEEILHLSDQNYTSTVFLPASENLLVATAKGALFKLNPNTKESKDVANLEVHPVENLTFSKNGKYLSAASEKGVVIYNASDYKKLGALPDNGWVTSFSPDGRELLSVKMTKEDNPAYRKRQSYGHARLWDLSALLP